MTLDRYNTDYFYALLLQQNESGNNFDLFKALYHDTDVSATLFNKLRQMMLDAEAAYNETPSNLYLTDTNNNTYRATGIDNFPHPPSK